MLFRKNVVTYHYKALFRDATGYQSDSILEAESEESARLVAETFADAKGLTVESITIMEETE